MKQTVTTDNKIFTYAMMGVVLLIAAICFTVSNFSHIAVLELSSSVIASTLSFSSVSLMLKAIKHDKHRIKEPVV